MALPLRLPEDLSDKVIEALIKKGVAPKCELCSRNNWSVVNQAVTLTVSDLTDGMILPTPNIPSAALVCKNCGNVRLFSLSVLGLLNQNQGDEK